MYAGDSGYITQLWQQIKSMKSRSIADMKSISNFSMRATDFDFNFMVDFGMSVVDFNI